MSLCWSHTRESKAWTGRCRSGCIRGSDQASGAIWPGAPRRSHMSRTSLSMTGLLPKGSSRTQEAIVCGWPRQRRVEIRASRPTATMWKGSERCPPAPRAAAESMTSATTPFTPIPIAPCPVRAARPPYALTLGSRYAVPATRTTLRDVGRDRDLCHATSQISQGTAQWACVVVQDAACLKTRFIGVVD